MNIICEFEEAEREYVENGVTYSSLGKKYGIKTSVLSAYGRANGWSDKRRERRRRAAESGKPSDISKLLSLSDTLEQAIGDVLHSSVAGDAPAETKNLKEISSLLKDAVSIRRDLIALSSGDQSSEKTGIFLSLGPETEEYCV